MAEEKRKKRTHEEVEAARKYYLEEKEKRRREKEERRKEREEALAERRKARELRQKVREMRTNRGKNKVKTLQDYLSEVYNSIPPYKGKLEEGDRIVCRFAGGYHIGEIYKIETIKVFDGGQYKDQKTFYIMEYGTRYPLSRTHILAKVDKEKFK